MGDIQEIENKRHKIRYKSLSAWILVICFFVSIITLIVYLAETDFSDSTLILLLVILRYSAFLVCLCSIYKFAVSIFFIIRRQHEFRPWKMIIFLVFILYGISIVYYEAFIVAFSRGNG